MKLNIFKFGYLPNRNPCNWWHNIKQFFKNCKGGWERATKGYAKSDTWNLCIYYPKLIVNTLTEFKNNLHSAPQKYFDATIDNATAPWQAYLQEMIEHFYNSIEENEVLKNEFQEEFYRLNLVQFEKQPDGNYSLVDNNSKEVIALNEKFYAKELEIAQWRDAERQKGFEMMQNVFWDLWD